MGGSINIKIEELSFDSQVAPVKLPVSFFELQDLPKNPFNIITGYAQGRWEEMSIRSISNIILCFLFEKSIKVKCVYKQRKIFFGLITWKFSEYELSSTIDMAHTQPLSWLETKMLYVLENSKERDMRSIIRLILELIVGSGNRYFNPGKIIFSKIIMESNTDLWLYKPYYSVHFLDNSKATNKIELIITEETKSQIRLEKEKFDNSMKELFFDNPQIKEIDIILRKIIKKQLREKSRELD